MTEGLRGATGDKGENGMRGSQGVAGRAGARGLAGLTGDTGDKGLSGPDGPVGDRGRRGSTGVVGLRGRTGVALSRRQNLVMFLSMFTAFIALAVNNEATAQDLRDYQYKICQQSVERVTVTNAKWQALADVETRNPFMQTAPETVKERIDIYLGAVVAVPNCENP